MQYGVGMRARSVVQCSSGRIREMNVHAIKSMLERKKQRKKERKKEKTVHR